MATALEIVKRIADDLEELHRIVAAVSIVRELDESAFDTVQRLANAELERRRAKRKAKP